MSLPVVRLAVVNNTDVTAVSDPKDATLTLYAFLKSVTTSSECSYAFQDLKRSLLAADVGSGFASDKRFGGFSNRSAKFESLLHRVESITRPYFTSQAPKMLHPLLCDGHSVASESNDSKQKRYKVIIEFLQGKRRDSKVDITPVRHNDNSCMTPSEKRPHYRESIDNIVRSRVCELTRTDDSCDVKGEADRQSISLKESVDKHKQVNHNNDASTGIQSPTRVTDIPKMGGLTVEQSYKAVETSHCMTYPRVLATVLRDIQNGLEAYNHTSSLSSAEDAHRKDHEISATNRNKAIDLLTRLEAIKGTVLSSSLSNMPSKVTAMVAELMQRVRNVQIVQLLEQHEVDTLKLTELGLQTECAALKKQCKSVVSCVVRAEARLTGEDTSLPPTDPRYVSEHCLFEGVQESLQEATKSL